MTRKDIMCERGAERIAFRSTQGTGRHLKARWTELEVWFRHEANGRPPFVTVTVGCSTHIGEEQRETVQEAATLRIAGTHFMREALPAIAVREEAQAWWERHSATAARDQLETVVGDAYQLAGQIAAEMPPSLLKRRMVQLLDLLASGADLTQLGMVERTAAALVETRRG